MEAAPLTQAHARLRESAASFAHDAPVQHSAAADGFAKAAEQAEDPEALRILRLLETEHRRLAHLIETKSPSSSKSGDTPDASLLIGETKTPIQKPSVPKRGSTDTETVVTAAVARRQTGPPQDHLPARPLSSSIASNLATARGINTNKHRSAGRRGTDLDQTSVKSNTVRVKPEVGAHSAIHARQESSATQEDDAFQKFYTGFEGLWSKLSAPLAFAGLPLAASPAESPSGSPFIPEESDHKVNRNISPPRSSSEWPDITSIYSKAAMKAIQHERGPVGNPQESFYVVPSSSKAQARVEDASTVGHSTADDDDDLFEDAKESPNRNSPVSSRQAGRASKFGQPRKTIEELQTENESLKSLTDNLSKRLYMWEKNAQSQTAAMQQSIRSLQPGHSTSNSRSKGQEDKILQMEEQLRGLQREYDQQQRENAKLKTVILRYRERWDKLKEGARVRRESNDRVPGEGSDV